MRSLPLGADLSMSGIAVRCGFPAPFNFSRLSKQRSVSSRLHDRAAVRPGLHLDRWAGRTARLPGDARGW